MAEAVRPRSSWAEPEPVRPAEVQALHAALSLPSRFCELLVRRGFADAPSVRAYLRPRLEEIPPADTLPDIDRAVERVEEAIAGDEPILVHGDYDVDGMASAALLARGLRGLGAHVEAFVPQRLRDGYDLGQAGLQRAEEIGAGLILTADCGMTADAAIEAAERAGREVVVTDHHRPGLRLPPARAVVNPHRADSEYPFEGLTGAGVAFKLVAELYRRADRPQGEVNRYLDLVAIGTIADRGPLVGENRALARAGLRVLARTLNVGLRSLISAARVEPYSGRVTAEDVAFRLAPRLNAAGRVGSAEEGLRLLITEDPEEAAVLAASLENDNHRRRATDGRVLEEAEAQLEERFLAQRDAAVVLWSDGWHPGVIGIVASKLAERLGRPSVLIALDGDLGRGSARSAGGVNLAHALEACAPLLERYGGHREAAGLDVRRSRLEEFKERFLREVASAAGAEAVERDCAPALALDLELTLTEAAGDLARWMRHLEPFGYANPRPVLLTRALRFESVSRVGGDRSHLRAVAVDEEGGRLPAIGFGMGERADDLERGTWDVAFELVEDSWRNRRRLQVRLLDARRA